MVDNNNLYGKWGKDLPELQCRDSTLANAHMDDNRSWANTSPYRSMDEHIFTRTSAGLSSVEGYRCHETGGWITPMKSALDSQIGGTHYGDNAIQPIEFITKNKLSFVIGSIIKYAVRADKKGGAEDLKKIIHYCQIELETKYGIRSEIKYQDK